MDRKKLLEWISHQPQDTRLACRQVLDVLFRVERDRIDSCTSFLTPDIAKQTEALTAHFPALTTTLFPIGCERTLLCIGTDDLDPEQIADVTVLRIESRKPLSHRDILGAVLSTGITRDRTGDIRLSDDTAEIMVKESVASFLTDSLGKIANETVRTTDLRSQQFSIEERAPEEKKIIVSSMRLDAVTAALMPASRDKAQQKIRKGEVKANHLVQYNPTTILKTGDVLSLRGFGRFEIASEEGLTKKGNFVVRIYHKQ